MPDFHARPHVNGALIARICSIAALGGVLYGYDMGIIAAAILFVKHSFSVSTQVEQLIVSVVLVGAMAGALIGGVVADRIGRRATLVWASIIFIVGSLLAPLSPNAFTLILARVIIGAGIGFTSVTAPVYASAIARQAHWPLSTCPNHRHRPRRSGRLLACSLRVLALDVRPGRGPYGLIS